MFAKLLKYNFKDTKRIGIPILICLLGITVLGCVDLGVMISYNKGGTDGSVLSAIFNMLLSSKKSLAQTFFSKFNQNQFKIPFQSITIYMTFELFTF